MKNLLFFLSLFFICNVLYGQTYNPTNFTVSNKAYGIAQAAPTDARSYFYDASLFIQRPYQSTAEVLSYLNLSKYRVGQFPIYISSGTLQSGGTFTGGTISEYYFRNGTSNSDLVLKYQFSKPYNVIIAPYNAPAKLKEGADYVLTGVRDNLLIQSILDNQPSTGTHIITLQGTINLDSTITIKKHNVQFWGAGMSMDTSGTGTYFKKTRDFTAFRIKSVAGTDIGLRGVSFHNFIVQGNGPSDTSGGFDVRNDTYNTASALGLLWESVNVSVTGYGAHVNGADFPQFDKVWFVENNHGLRVNGFAYGSICNSLFSDNTGYGINIQQSSMVVNGTTFVRNANYDIDVQGFTGWTTISGCFFESGSTGIDNIIFEGGAAFNTVTGATIKAKRRGISFLSGANGNTVSGGVIMYGVANTYFDGSGTIDNSVLNVPLKQPAVGGYNIYCTALPHANNFVFNPPYISGRPLDAATIYDISTAGNNYAPNTRLDFNATDNRSYLNSSITINGQTSINGQTIMNQPAIITHDTLSFLELRNLDTSKAVFYSKHSESGIVVNDTTSTFDIRTKGHKALTFGTNNGTAFSLSPDGVLITKNPDNYESNINGNLGSLSKVPKNYVDSVTALRQAVENQRLSSTNNPTFTGIQLNNNAGYSFFEHQQNGIKHWTFGESGANFVFTRWNSVGAYSGTPFYISNSTGDAFLENTITASQYKLSALNTAPASPTDAGVSGEVRVTADFIYVCIAANTWVRSALTTWVAE